MKKKTKNLEKKPLAKKIKSPKNKKQGLFSFFFKRRSNPSLQKEEKKDSLLKNDIEKISSAKDTKELLLIFKEIIEELRKENEELRKDRQFFLEQMKNILLGKMENLENNEIEEYPEIKEAEKENISEVFSSKKQSTSRKIETSLDSLLDIIMKKGTIKVSDAAKQLKVSEKQIEEWAHVLEEHDIIEIHYPAMGKPLLKKKP